MKELQKVLESGKVFWVGFSKPEECKRCLCRLKSLGFKWFNGKQINEKEKLRFYFTIEVNPPLNTVGFVPNHQRFLKKGEKPTMLII